jgi:carbon-monoxide dehydrogenase large subunit
MIGRRILRKEDKRFITGQGRYVGDVQLPGTKHVALLRSRLPHARIGSIDVSQARRLHGVVGVYTGADIDAITNRFDHLLPPPTFQPLRWPVLALDKVRFVGEPLAAVVADTRAIAEDALDLIQVDFDELEPVVDMEAALGPGSPLLYEEWGTNEFLHLEHENGPLQRVFEEAPHVFRERFYNHRVMAVPLEGHGVVAVFQPADGLLTVWSSQQQPHQLRTVLADITGMSESRIRVIAPDIGGGFGNKQHFFREEALVAVLATLLPHSVSWIEDRVESLTASVHSREQVHEVEIAHDGEGKILGMRARLTADLGNPVLYFTGAAPALVATAFLTGGYEIQNYGFEVRGVATTKCPNGAYRGFGRPQALFSIERSVDMIAHRLGLEPVEVRRRNLLPPEPRPYLTATGARFDCGDVSVVFERVLRELDYEGWKRRQAELPSEGRYIGVGVTTHVEGVAPNQYGDAGRFGAYELCSASVLPDGQVSLTTGAKSTGQGHETSLAQVAADILTIPVEHVHYVDGDTDLLPYGMGSWGSRTAVMGGGAVVKAVTEIRNQMLRIAAHMLQAPVAEVRLENGEFWYGQHCVPFRAVAEASYFRPFELPDRSDIGISAIVSYDPGFTTEMPDENGKRNASMTYGAAATGVVVEVDIHTGKVTVLDAVVVADTGRVINPTIVEGQIQGGFAQGVGTTLLEEMVYSPDGIPLTATLLDYQVPNFGDVPRVRVYYEPTEPEGLLGGFRGVGELGIIVAPATIANAVSDALRPFGVEVRQTNLGPQHIRHLLREAGAPFDPVAAALGRDDPASAVASESPQGAS